MKLSSGSCPIYFMAAVALCLLATCQPSLVMANTNTNTNTNINANININAKHHATDSEWGQMKIATNTNSEVDNHLEQQQVQQQGQQQEQEKEEVQEIQDMGAAVAIVGGGIAGFALAAGLSRLNVPFVLYERAPQLRTQSQGMLVLRSSGYRAMESIDAELALKVQSEGVEFETLKFKRITCGSKDDDDDDDDDEYNNDGKDDPTGININKKDVQITEGEMLTMKEMEVKKNGVATIAMKWNVLQSTLASSVPVEAIQTGHSLTSFQEEQDDSNSNSGSGSGVILTFDNGKRVRCRALLACDGTFSQVRKQMYDPKMDPIINYGMVNWSSIIPRASLPGGRPLTHTITAVTNLSPPKLYTFLNQCGDDEVFWQIRIVDRELGFALSANGGRGGLGLVGAKEKLQSVLTGPGFEELAGAVAATPEENIFERCIVARGSVPGPWTGAKGVSEGRVTLVGDAAHAMHPAAGIGANTALEGAASLIDSIRKRIDQDSTDDICWERVLNDYEQKHRPRADLNQRFSNIFGLGDGFTKPIEALIGGPDGLKQLQDWTQQAVVNAGEPPKGAADALSGIDVMKRDGISPLLY